MVLKLIKQKPYRLLLVTFDLTSTVPGDQRYRQVDAALSFHGPVFRPVKQLRLVISRSTSQRIKSSIEQRIGRRATIFISPITSIPAWRIHGAQKQREWKRFIQALVEHNVEIKYASEASENEL